MVFSHFLCKFSKNKNLKIFTKSLEIAFCLPYTKVKLKVGHAYLGKFVYFKEEIIIMTKTELVAEVATRAETSKKEAEASVNAVLDAITDCLKKEEKVQLIGFGTFEVRHRAEREGNNPRTKEKITIPATKAPAFKPGKGLKDAIL